MGLFGGLFGGGGGKGGCLISPAAARVLHQQAAQQQATQWSAVQAGYLAYLQKRDTWQMLLGGFVGTYALIRAYSLYQDQLDIAERTWQIMKGYYDLAVWNYHNVVYPTWTRMRDLYDRYKIRFQSYEELYMDDAFHGEHQYYRPDYDTQESRVFGKVQAHFDRALRQMNRARGKYNAGRPCHNTLWFSVMAATARVDMTNHAFRQEEHKKWSIVDVFVWKKRSDASAFQRALADRAAAAINRGVAGATAGISAIGPAASALVNANEPVAAATANMGNFWGSLANGAFAFAGAQSMRGASYGWLPPPYGGGSYGLHGPGATNFAPTGTGAVGAGLGQGTYASAMAADSHGGGVFTAGGFSGGLPSIPGGPGIPGDPWGGWAGVNQIGGVA